MSHQAVPGWCPLFDGTKCRAYSGGRVVDSSEKESQCATPDNWKTCGNWESFQRGDYHGDW